MTPVFTMSRTQTNPMPNHSHSQRGVTMIEVLVALMILVFSLLGVAAVQLRLEQYTQSAIARSQSSNALTDIIEKMRTNRTAAVNTQSYNTEFAATAPVCSAPDLITRYADKTGLKDAANSAALASQELIQLQKELACMLPLGTMRIVTGQATTATTASTNCSPALVNAAEDVLTIIVRYDDRKVDVEANQTAQSTGNSTPVYRCFTEVVQL
jgi:type IV pilus assembly protein PilV